MAIFAANKGQSAKVALTIQFSDGSGVATDPTGTVNLKVYYADPAGSLTLVTTLNPTKQASLAGFYGAFLDISNATTFPAGEYVLRWDATVAGTATAAQDTLQLQDAASVATSAPLASAYCTESQIRNWIRPLEDTKNVSSALVAAKAADGATVIDATLRRVYAVPFALPADPIVVEVNVWLAAAYILENREGEVGNKSKLGSTLEKRALDELAAIAAGDIALTVTPRTTVLGPASVRSNTLGLAKTFEFDSTDSPRLSRY